MQFLYKKNVVRALIIAAGLYILYYLVWRAVYSLNGEALGFSIVLLLAEVQGVISFLLFGVTAWNYGKIERHEPMHGASVDVFVPIYNEDLSILEATLTGCNHMRLRHTTYVLDDGRRPEVKDLAERMNCKYLTRDNNEFAKAGNINAAIKKTKGDFLVMLDADMVPQPDFLEKTLGYFKDSKTAIVQLPQEFYNLDSMQHNERPEKSYWHEQQPFYHVVQPGKDGMNAAIWCGNPSVVRRAAIEDIGGIPTDSVTEDFLTSIRLNAKGWKIRYHHETLAFGIAPQSFHAFNVQRLRWARGAMNILRSRDNPLVKKGLKPGQRLAHFAGLFSYFDAYRKLIYFLTPAIILITGVLPIKASAGADFLWRWLPCFLLMTITNTAAGRGYFEFFTIEKFNALKMPVFIKASFSLIIPHRNVSSVTPKNADADVKHKDRRELVWQFVILSITAASFVFAAGKMIILKSWEGASAAAVLAAMFWSLFNGYILIIALHDVLKRLYNRKDFRFPIPLSVHITDRYGNRYEAAVEDISRGGASIILEQPKKEVYWDEKIAPLKDGSDPVVHNRPLRREVISCDPARKYTRTAFGSFGHRDRALLDGADINISLPGGPINVIGKVAYDRELAQGKRKIGLKFEDLCCETAERLEYFLYVTAPRRLSDEGALSPKRAAEKKPRYEPVPNAAAVK